MSLHALQTTSDRPLYLQVVDSLRVDIANKAPGDKIDSEPQLSKRFGVSRFTVTRAIEILVDEGLISRRQGLGTFVAAPPLKRAPSYLSSFSEAISSAGRIASHRVLAFGPAPWREGLPYREDERPDRAGSPAPCRPRADRDPSFDHFGCDRRAHRPDGRRRRELRVSRSIAASTRRACSSTAASRRCGRAAPALRNQGCCASSTAGW